MIRLRVGHPSWLQPSFMPPRKGKSVAQKLVKDVVPSSQGSRSRNTGKFLIPLPPPPRSNHPTSSSRQDNTVEDSLWADTYHPSTEQELAVHKKKVDIVRKWFRDAFEGINLKRYRKILVLSGPAGCGKTATLNVLSKEMKFTVVEWQNKVDDAHIDDYESFPVKFGSFMSRAANFSPLMSEPQIPGSQNHIILLEDLPNLSYAPTLQAFHAALINHIETSDIPVVIIVSNAGIRGQTKDEEGWSSRQSTVPTAFNILPPALRGGPFVTQVEFNPIAATLMKTGLKWVLDSHFANNPKLKPSKDVVDAVVDTSRGDIRSALMSLQFMTMQGSFKGNSRYSKNSLVIETNREHSLALFHLLGKILYNKRVGDPISTTLSKKDQALEQEYEKLLPSPIPLPAHLSQFDRRASKVDVDVLYTDSAIDTSLLSLYIHQNYSQFCEDVDQCDGIMDALSMIDSLGEAWDSRGQVAAEKFHVVTTSTLMSLPSPVPRANQKMFKPAYFDNFKQQQQAQFDIITMEGWLAARGSVWNQTNAALHLPIILKHSSRLHSLQDAPNHLSFSSIPWVRNSPSMGRLLEEDEEDESTETAEEPERKNVGTTEPEPESDSKFWLEEDDIGDF